MNFMISLTLRLMLELNAIQNHNTNTWTGEYKYTTLQMRNADIYENTEDKAVANSDP